MGVLQCTGKREKIARFESFLLPTNVPEFDEFFSDVIRVISDLEDIDKNLTNAKSQLLEICAGDATAELTINDIFLLFLWTLSANFEGQIAKSGFKCTTKPQFFFTINPEIKLRPSFEQFYRAMRKYFLAVQNLDTQSKTLIAEFRVTIQQLKDGELFKNSEAVVNRASLPPEKRSEALQNIKKNKQKIQDFQSNPPLIANRVQIAKGEVLKIATMMEGGFEKVDKIGLKAFKNNLLEPSQIFEFYYKS